MLLPPDLKDWVADDDLAHFVLEAVEATDMSVAQCNQRGTGSRQYPPTMMLALLIYCYATGRFSSRQIERATFRDVSVRYLAADTHPDHDTICKFRRENRQLIHACFVRVLELARELGLLQMGTISIDGTKIMAATSKRATQSAQEIELELARWDRKVAGLLEQAEEADVEGVEDPTRLPHELAQAQNRRARLQAAKELLEKQSQERARRREQEREQARRTAGRELPKKLPAKARPKDTVNMTDPESRLMPRRQGDYIQGYNGQLAVSVQAGGGLIVNTGLSDQSQDRRELLPMVQSLPSVLERPANILVDKGYDNTDQIAQVQSQGGARVFCPLNGPPGQESPGYRQTAWHQERARRRRRMAERMKSPEGRAMLKRRGSSVEPVIGILKSAMGFESFRLRGRAKAALEWELVSLAFNCRRISRRKRA